MMRRSHRVPSSLALALALALPLACDLDRTIDEGLEEPESEDEVADDEALDPGMPGMEPPGPEPGEPGEPVDEPDLEEGMRPETSAILDCATDAGYEVSTWRAAEAESTRLWVGGVYETRSDHSGGYHPTGTAHVDWRVPGSNVLVLSSYEPTDWTVALQDGGELYKVIAIGYHLQSVSAPPGVIVQTFSYEAGDSVVSCGYSLPGNGGGCEGEELVAVAQDLTGLGLYGFDGCYRATAFDYRE